MWHRSHNHSHFAKHFTKWLQLHQRSHYFATATATAVLATAEALPKGPLALSCLHLSILSVIYGGGRHILSTRRLFFPPSKKAGASIIIGSRASCFLSLYVP
jgi:hypothetical protein